MGMTIGNLVPGDIFDSAGTIWIMDDSNCITQLQGEHPGQLITFPDKDEEVVLVKASFEPIEKGEHDG